MDGKICPSCHMFKSYTGFAKNRSKRDGYQVYCKPCANEKTKKFFKTEKGRAAQQRANKSPAGREAMRRYDRSEKGKLKHARHEETDKYKAAHRRANRAYQQANKEKINAQCAVYNAVKRGQMPSAKTLNCCHCGQQARHYHHHQGYDSDHRLDVVPVCAQCHGRIHHPRKQNTP